MRSVVTPDGLRVWLVTRYADVRAGLNDPRLSKDFTRVQHLYRRHTVEGMAVREVNAGEFVLFALAAANRDHDRFPAPDRFDPTREANAHLSFGHGIHYRLGAPLARQEAETAFRHWFERHRRIEPAQPDEVLEYRHSLLMRGPTTLRLRVAA